MWLSVRTLKYRVQGSGFNPQHQATQQEDARETLGSTRLQPGIPEAAAGRAQADLNYTEHQADAAVRLSQTDDEQALTEQWCSGALFLRILNPSCLSPESLANLDECP